MTRPSTQQIEQATFNLHEVMQWVAPDSQSKDQTEEIDENKSGEQEGQAKWQLNKHQQHVGVESFISYTVTKQGLPGDIYSVEFVP